MRTVLRIGKAALAGAHIILLGGWVWLGLENRGPGTAGGKAVVFEARKGKAVAEIAADLKAEGLIRKRTPFVLAYKLFFEPRGVKAGEYELSADGRILDILGKLVEGRVALHPVTIAEGWTIKETAAHLASAGFGRSEDFEAAAGETVSIALLDPRATSLEGYLFPETYHFPKGSTATEIVERMTIQFLEVFDAAFRARAAERESWKGR